MFYFTFFPRQQWKRDFIVFRFNLVNILLKYLGNLSFLSPALFSVLGDLLKLLLFKMLIKYYIKKNYLKLLI